MTTIIDIELKDGRTSGPGRFRQGQPGESDELRRGRRQVPRVRRFRRWPKDKAESIVGMVRDLESLPAIGRLTALLRTSRRRGATAATLIS